MAWASTAIRLALVAGFALVGATVSVVGLLTLRADQKELAWAYVGGLVLATVAVCAIALLLEDRQRTRGVVRLRVHEARQELAALQARLPDPEMTRERFDEAVERFDYGPFNRRDLADSREAQDALRWVVLGPSWEYARDAVARLDRLADELLAVGAYDDAAELALRAERTQAHISRLDADFRHLLGLAR